MFLETLVIIYTIYMLVVVYTSVMQIGFISEEKSKMPIILNQGDYIKAGNYSIVTERVKLVNSIYDFFIFLGWIGFGLTFLEESLSGIENGVYKSILFVNIFLAVNYVLHLPFDIYSTFVVDKEFGFSKISKKLYIQDSIKSIALFLVFGSALIGAISYIIDSFESWWIYGFILFFSVIILINAIYPTLIAPMFNKFSSLEDEVLIEKIENLLKSVGFKSSGVFTIDASKRDSRLNAYFGGLGATKRVVLFDTLIQKLSHNELLAVLGHELGHFKNRDMIKNIATMGVVFLFLFYIFSHIPISVFEELNISSNSYSIIVLFFLFSPMIMHFLMPIISLISRNNEYAADEFGSNLASKNDLINALLKLANENRSFPKSHKIYIFFYYSHPPLIERLKHLGYRFNE